MLSWSVSFRFCSVKMIDEILLLLPFLSIACCSTAVQFLPSQSFPSLPHISSFSTFTIHEKNPLLDSRNLNLLVAHLNQGSQFGGDIEHIHWDLQNPAHSAKMAQLEFKLGRDGHITPDFSNGLDYQDPYLLTGYFAQRAAKLLYSRELFFKDIPHSRSILHHQKQRRQNGLDGNRLGSLNPNSPFFRRYRPINQYKSLK